MPDAAETTVPDARSVAFERPELLIFCGLAGLAGIVAPMAMLVVSSFVAEHDFVADTISDLARGPHKWIMDLGFYLNAAGLLALAIGAAHAHLGRIGWSLGLLSLALTALVVVLLGLWDEFDADNESPADWSVHTRLSILLGPLFLAGPLLMARGAAGVARVYGWLFIAAAILWILLAAAYWMAPTDWDGIVEKAALAATMLWTVPLAWLFLARGRRSRRTAAR